MTNEKETLPPVAFHQHGEEFYLVRRGTGITHMELPPGTYEVAYNSEKGFYLDRVKDMKLPSRVYGDVETFANRVMRRFDVGNENMGVMLIGRKGSGKTLTLKKLSELSIRMTMPVVLVQQAFSGMGLGRYLSMFEQPMMVAMDEFDKMYAPTKDEHDASGRQPGHPAGQNEIISLLQGTMGGGKKLYVFSANSAANVSEYLKNRPGRIRYTKTHGGMEQGVILEYAREHLADKSDQNVASLLTVSRQAADFNFDMMQAIVEDMNLYKENAYEAAQLIVSGAAYAHDQYIVEVRKAGQLISERTSSFDMLGAPTFYANVYYTTALDSEDIDLVELTHKDFKSFGESLLDVVYEKGDIEVTFLYASAPYESEDAPRFLPKPTTPRKERVKKLYEDQRERSLIKQAQEEALKREQQQTSGAPDPAPAMDAGQLRTVIDPHAKPGTPTPFTRKSANGSMSGSFAPRAN